MKVTTLAFTLPMHVSFLTTNVYTCFHQIGGGGRVTAPCFVLSLLHPDVSSCLDPVPAEMKGAPSA